MTLFKVREWWEAKRTGESTPSTLSVGNLIDQQIETSQVIVGCVSGLIQIFQPTSQNSQDYRREEDLILEQQLPAPILQAQCGYFTSGGVSGSQQLAILHSKQLSVYQISREEGLENQGDSTSLSLVYQHRLSRSAHSFLTGNFGGVKSKEYIAVLSLDGVLSVFEQDTHAFSSVLIAIAKYWIARNYPG